MKLSGSIPVSVAALGCVLAAMHATAAPVADYTRGNEAFAISASVMPAVERPEVASRFQEKRVPQPTLEKSSADIGDRRAAIVVAETHEKKILSPESHRPVPREFSLSPLNRQPANLSTAGDTRKPALVAKYQDRLSAANAVTIGRTPAIDRGGTARLNRFVFRHNAPAPLPAPAAAVPIAAAPSDDR